MSIVGGRGRSADLTGSVGAWGFASGELGGILDILDGDSSGWGMGGLIGGGAVPITGCSGGNSAFTLCLARLTEPS